MYGDNEDKKKRYGNTKKSRRKEIRGLKKEFRKGSREYIKEGDKKVPSPQQQLYIRYEVLNPSGAPKT